MKSLSRLFLLGLLVFTTTSAVQAQAPAGTAQWSIGREVTTLSHHSLLNSKTQKHLFRHSSGRLDWTIERFTPTTFFENCTRPGEIVYGSDRVAIRYGREFLIETGGASGRGWTSDREEGCVYRLIPSASGFVSAGSGDRKFAIYNTRNNAYLIRTDSLIWKQMERPPDGVVAAADLVVQEFRHRLSSGNSLAILHIKNIGNVRTMASQQELKFRLNGREMSTVLFQPLPPGDTHIRTIAWPGLLPRCVLVELDTWDKLKFQTLKGAVSNDFVFANDRKNMRAPRPGDVAATPCPSVVGRP
jgi:hypothetical protein